MEAVATPEVAPEVTATPAEPITIDDAVRACIARRQVADIEAEIKTAKARHKAELLPLQGRLSVAQDEADEITEAAKKKALAAYHLDPANLHPVPGFDVDVTTKYEYNTDTVLAWARRNYTAAVNPKQVIPESLNVTALKVICKDDATRPECVKAIPEPVVTLWNVERMEKALLDRLHAQPTADEPFAEVTE